MYLLYLLMFHCRLYVLMFHGLQFLLKLNLLDQLMCRQLQLLGAYNLHLDYLFHYLLRLKQHYHHQ
ncbi:MAG: hypothetical protein EBT68_06785 [Verrucomicrobia bacterium]|nr:hypothetical protein [Verrucomicrobiota bacterium]